MAWVDIFACKNQLEIETSSLRISSDFCSGPEPATMAVGFCLLFLICSSIFHTGSAYSDITDSHGNVAYTNGTIHWVKYSDNTQYASSNSSYEQGKLEILFEFAQSFLDTIQPNQISFGEFDGFQSCLNDLKCQIYNGSDFTLNQRIRKPIKHLIFDYLTYRELNSSFWIVYACTI